MAQQLTIVAVSAALVSLLEAQLQSYSTDSKVDVREASKQDFSDDGQLVLRKIAVRVRFGQAEYLKARDISMTTQEADLHYQAICRHESLRGAAEMRSRTLELVVAVQNELAGARLLLSNGTKSGPIELTGVVAVSDQYGPVEECFGVTFIVHGMTQYDGRNSNPQPGGGA